MTHPLSRVPVLGKFVDERFLEYRRRSTTLAGIVSTLLAVALFEYHFFRDHVVSWDLLAVTFTMVAVKITMMIWYRFNG